ncbi:MAG: twin-arginine translocase subunit TatC [Planctomycetales bacterium]|nr:twin-arginine translocase subunit TatC [Planctomycetales bacterium]MBN8624992.1 twin-arginine translocase subunit TatC [Planctomycetota bacterium]
MSTTPSKRSGKNDEDLFAETTMTFGEHLDELRVCLFRAIVGLVLGTIVGLFLGNDVVEVIEHPLTEALKDYYELAAEKEYKAWAQEQTNLGRSVPYNLSEIKAIAKPATAEQKELIYELEFWHPTTILGALEHARTTPTTETSPNPTTPTATAMATGTRPIAAGTTANVDATKSSDANPQDNTPGDAKTTENKPESGAEAEKKDEPIRYTRGDLEPILLWHPIDSDNRFKLQATGTTEVFTVWLKAALVIGVLLSSPWVFYQIWSFVAAGLYMHERKYVYTFLPFSLGLFLLGAATAYMFVFEPVLKFLFSFNQDLGIDPDPKISEWLGFVLLMPLGFGVSFQLPLVMLFLERIGVFTVKDFLEKWRIAVLVIFIISAVLTPADPYSIFFMAVPLTFLYFGGILLAKYLPKK